MKNWDPLVAGPFVISFHAKEGKRTMIIVKDASAVGSPQKGRAIPHPFLWQYSGHHKALLQDHDPDRKRVQAAVFAVLPKGM